MPKIKDFMPAIKTIATASNPVIGAGIAMVEKLFTKPKKKVEVMLKGKKTYIGIIIAIIPVIAKLFGYEVTAEFTAGAETSLNEFATLIGGAIAFYGRMKTDGSSFFKKK